jgi:hypothetical protein
MHSGDQPPEADAVQAITGFLRDSTYANFRSLPDGFTSPPFLRFLPMVAFDPIRVWALRARVCDPRIRA